MQYIQPRPNRGKPNNITQSLLTSPSSPTLTSTPVCAVARLKPIRRPGPPFPSLPTSSAPSRHRQTRMSRGGEALSARCSDPHLLRRPPNVGTRQSSAPINEQICFFPFFFFFFDLPNVTVYHQPEKESPVFQTCLAPNDDDNGQRNIAHADATE